MSAAVARIDRPGFFGRLRQVVDNDDPAGNDEHDERRRACDALMVANAAANETIIELDGAIDIATDKIATAAAQLVKEQESRAALIQQRHQVKQHQLDATRPLTELLRRSASDVLIDFTVELRWYRFSAEFQLGAGRPVPSERPQSGVFAQERQRQIEEAQAEIDAQLDLIGAFLRRVRKVAPVAEELIYRPDADAEARVAELRRDIAPIPEIVAKGWQATAKTQLAIGRASP